MTKPNSGKSAINKHMNKIQNTKDEPCYSDGRGQFGHSFYEGEDKCMYCGKSRTTTTDKPMNQIDNQDKIILDLCGGTGSWSKPYKDNGYKVFNLTLPEYDVTKPQEFPSEVLQAINDGNVYGILAAPPCTMFSDARTNAKTPRDLQGGMKIVLACLKIIYECQFKTKSDQQKFSPLKFWALENPWYGRLKWFLGHPNFVFDPWEFGDAYKKRTALWGYFNLPIKTHTTISNVMTKEQIEAHKTNSQALPKFDRLLMPELKELKGVNNSDYWKQTKLRQTLRAITPQGFALSFYKANL